MQEKTWYYEKWVGRQASFSPSRYVKELAIEKGRSVSIEIRMLLHREFHSIDL